MEFPRHPHLEEIVSKANTDESFCDRLLNGERGHVVSEYGLTQVEQDVVLAIRADTLQAFAEKLLSWMEQREAL